MAKKSPDGFVARCPQCGVVTGAMDYTRTGRKDASEILGKWLMTGHVVEPRFNDWQATVEQCRCKPEDE